MSALEINQFNVTDSDILFKSVSNEDLNISISRSPSKWYSLNVLLNECLKWFGLDRFRYRNGAVCAVGWKRLLVVWIASIAAFAGFLVVLTCQYMYYKNAGYTLTYTLAYITSDATIAAYFLINVLKTKFTSNVYGRLLSAMQEIDDSFIAHRSELYKTLNQSSVIHLIVITILLEYISITDILHYDYSFLIFDWAIYIAVFFNDFCTFYALMDVTAVDVRVRLLNGEIVNHMQYHGDTLKPTVLANMERRYLFEILTTVTTISDESMVAFIPKCERKSFENYWDNLMDVHIKIKDVISTMSKIYFTQVLFMMLNNFMVLLTMISAYTDKLSSSRDTDENEKELEDMISMAWSVRFQYWLLISCLVFQRLKSNIEKSSCLFTKILISQQNNPKVSSRVKQFLKHARAPLPVQFPTLLSFDNRFFLSIYGTITSLVIVVQQISHTERGIDLKI